MIEHHAQAQNFTKEFDSGFHREQRWQLDMPVSTLLNYIREFC